MAESLTSVGIDLGTTTTQVVFSRLTVENTAGAASVPRVQIVEKKIIHQGGIHFTPLLGPSVIDAEGVLALVEGEYRDAGLKPSDVSAGAVIITGETARKENSEKVLRTLSGLAGDFVVATAGSDLESILAGRGAGTARMSKNSPGRALANLDIGGGTTNIAVFLDGLPVETSCLDIGGRQIMVDGPKGFYGRVSPKYAELGAGLGLRFEEGGRVDRGDLDRLCGRLAEILALSLGLAPVSDRDRRDLELMITAHPLAGATPVRGLTFSGGVADCVYGAGPADPFLYGDVGPLLGRAVARCPMFRDAEILRPLETIRATVVGAGSNSLELSGSTVTVSHPDVLPLKNVPILKLAAEDEADDHRYLSSRLAEKVSWFREGEDGGHQTLAVALKGPRNPTYEKVVGLGDKLVEGLDYYLSDNDVLIVVVENDLAKSLGQALSAALPDKKIVSLDTVMVENGDYIDIGLPVAGGRVVPVVVKTLVFGR
ncbi:MAG: ethanolamine ammonia-lyase reactivating factor EutA [Deltaproteobacteria bacterium]|nr:ethanolamine ammonia-lyase reactivating factor EutA [Deltaproteobacteria bacterium]